MTPIENYIDQKRHSSPFGLLLDIRYKNVKDIPVPRKPMGFTEPTVIITPYWKYPVMLSPVLIMYGFITYKKIPAHDWLEPLLITIGIAVVLLTILIRSKRNPEVNLTADREKVVVKKATYYWKDIAEVYIMSEHGAKKNSKWLLFEKRDGFITYASIDYIGISDSKVAAIVKHYIQKSA